MAVYVSDLLTVTPAPVDATPASTRALQWLRGSTTISGATSTTYTTTADDIGSSIFARQSETNFLGTTIATSAPTETVEAYNPAALFRSSEPGVWFDPNDITTLYKGTTNLTPVTTPGDAVSLMLDKSRGPIGPDLTVNGDFANGLTGWTADVGWSADNNTAKHVFTATDRQIVQGAAVAGRTYLITYDVVNHIIGGTMAATCGGTIGTLSNRTNGRYYEVITAAGTGGFGIYAGGTWQGSVDNISVKEIPGNHATQATETKRPNYGIVPAGGRRNLLLWTEAVNNTLVWATRSVTATADVLTATAGDDHDVLQAVPSVTGNITFSVKVKAGTVNFAWLTLSPTFGLGNYATVVVSLTTGAVTKTQSFGNVSILSSVVSPVDANGFYRIAFSVSSGGVGITALIGMSTSATPTISTYGSVGFSPVGTETIQVKEAQLETSTTATPYQRVTSQYDVTEAGVASLGYLRFDGTDDFMRTARMPAIAQPYQMWAALEPTAFVAGNYTYIFDSFDGTNRAYLAFAGGTGSTTTGNYRMAAVTEIASATILSAGSRYVATASFSGAASEVRSNGVSVLTGDAGTGSFDGLTIGTRFSNSSYQNGKFFGGIVHGGAITAARINATEAWLNDRTGAY